MPFSYVICFLFRDPETDTLRHGATEADLGGAGEQGGSGGRIHENSNLGLKL